jgi:hypothetical protein
LHWVSPPNGYAIGESPVWSVIVSTTVLL